VKRTSLTFAVFAMAVSAFMPALASDKANVMGVVQKWADSFNSSDVEAGRAVCAPDAVVLDDFPPHVWQGSDARGGQGFKGYSAMAVKASITDGKIVVGVPSHLDIELNDAYLVAPVVLTFNKCRKPVKDDGVVTMALHKGDAGWRITGWAWPDQ
jgi:ketosteroid isomerase-like protein